jgi:hypothetical protein
MLIILALPTLLSTVFSRAFTTLPLAVLAENELGPPSSQKYLLHFLYRKACEHALRRVVSNPNSSENERALAVKIYRTSKTRALRAGATRQELLDLECFLDIENNQADSKIFWSKAKRVMTILRTSINPPPMVEYVENDITKCETDPLKTLKIWKRFWTALANPSSDEEAKYDDNYKKHVESRLHYLKTLPINQPRFDQPITREETWKAVRKLKEGKAAGVDGVLTTILKTAAAAVGTNKLKPCNPVIDSLVLLFNFVFSHEVWPKR